MTKQYKNVRFPIDSYLKEKRRMEELSKRFSQISGKKKNIKFTQLLELRASKPMFIYDDELVNFFSKKSTKRYSIL